MFTFTTVLGWLYFELESYVMLLAAADPSSCNLFSGVIRLLCFIIDYALR